MAAYGYSTKIAIGDMIEIVITLYFYINYYLKFFVDGKNSEAEFGHSKSYNGSECNTPKTPKSAKVDDRHFFGSNFNLDSLSADPSCLARIAAGK